MTVDQERKRKAFMVAGLLLIGSLQYFAAEYIAAQAWSTVPYSWSRNDISDLGVPECSLAGENGLNRTICSPLYWVMNAGFLIQAVIVGVSLFVIWNDIPKKIRKSIGILSALYIVGISMVALFPGTIAEEFGGDRVRAIMHTAGAVLAIIGGNLLAVFSGYSFRRKHKGYGTISMLLGTTGIAASIFLVFGQNFGLGPGGIERVAVNTIVFWLIFTGGWLLMQRPKNTNRQN